MALGVFLGGYSGAYVRSLSLNSWRQLRFCSYNIAKNIEMDTNKIFNRSSTHHPMESEETFEKFKQKFVKSFEDYKKLPYIRQIYGDDIEKISIAYDNFCKSKFLQYKHIAAGNDPSGML